MILELMASALLSPGRSSSRGASDAAAYVARQALIGLQYLQKSDTPGLGRGLFFEDLQRIQRECSQAGWDGYGAAPIRNEVFLYATQFIDALPLGTINPSLGAEPDGHLTLEWHRTPRHTLSVSISPSGDLHYAALLGSAKQYGTEPFFGDMPLPILRLIQILRLLNVPGAV